MPVTKRLALPFIALGLVGAAAGAARACSLAPGFVEHVLDAAEQAVDMTPPSAAPVVEGSYGDRNASNDGCTAQASSCDDLFYVELLVTAPAQDDRTPSDQLGYRLELVAGAPPADLPAEPVRPWDVEHIRIDYVDDPDDPMPFDFTVRLIPVDLAGNEGPASEPLQLRFDPPSGCRFTGRAQPALWMLPLIGLALFGRRRRR
jgi:MYXO-CTERM domain-containing protein